MDNGIVEELPASIIWLQEVKGQYNYEPLGP
jgi:hypothetical protein